MIASWVPNVAPGDVLCTGTTNPDISGAFYAVDDYGGYGSWRHWTNTFYIWYDGVADEYEISRVRGTLGSEYWTLGGPNPEGEYTAMGTNTGNATIAIVS